MFHYNFLLFFNCWTQSFIVVVFVDFVMFRWNFSFKSMYISVICENIDISIIFAALIISKAYFINLRFRRTFFIVYFVFLKIKTTKITNYFQRFKSARFYSSIFSLYLIIRLTSEMKIKIYQCNVLFLKHVYKLSRINLWFLMIIIFWIRFMKLCTSRKYVFLSTCFIESSITVILLL